MNQHPILTISICVSKKYNEVKRCLSSLSSLMKHVDCELILTDTSQDPDIHNLCLEYTNNVINFKWCDDFSKARNIGIEAAQGEWFFYLDDDEWLENSDEIEFFFLSKKYQNYGVANLFVRNFYDTEMSHYGELPVTRLFRLKDNIRFYGRIHEFPQPLDGHSYELSTRIMHSGYIAVSEEDTYKKFDRNYPLLEKTISEEPHLLRWRVQAVQELLNVKDWKRLTTTCQKALDDKEQYEDLTDLDLDTLRAGLIEGLVESKQNREAMATARTFLDSTDVSMLCKAYIHLQLANNYIQVDDLDLAMQNLEIYYKTKEYYDKHPEELIYCQNALIISRTFEFFLLSRAYSLKMIIAIKTNNEKIMALTYPELKWDEKAIYLDNGLMDCLMTDGINMLDNSIICQAFSDLWNNSKAAEMLINYSQTGYEADSLDGVEKAIAFFCKTNPKGQVLFDHAFETQNPTEHITRMVAIAKEHPGIATVIKNYINIYRSYL